MHFQHEYIDSSSNLDEYHIYEASVPHMNMLGKKWVGLQKHIKPPIYQRYLSMF